MCTDVLGNGTKVPRKHGSTPGKAGSEYEGNQPWKLDIYEYVMFCNDVKPLSQIPAAKRLQWWENK